MATEMCISISSISIFYICTSLLLFISMHRESGHDSEVDPIMKLIWSKVCRGARKELVFSNFRADHFGELDLRAGSLDLRDQKALLGVPPP